jgi:LacI family transcriptional regulator
MAVTIRDVARRLNISITTVSRALDGYDDVAEETRQRVVQTAHEMGYSPNRAARQLRRHRSETIGYILAGSEPRFSDPFESEWISGLVDETAQSGYDLLVTASPGGADEELQTYGRWVHAGKVEGFVLNHIWQQDVRINYLAEQKTPFVTLERSLDHLNYPSIQVESVDSVAGLVAHLARQGARRIARRIAYIGGPPGLSIQHDRFEGYRKGLAENHCAFDPKLVASADLTSSGGYQAARHMLWIPDPPDAVLCINDETAFGVLHAAREAHRNVGVDLAVAGFDGVQDSRYSQPPLTTLDQPVYQIARQLVRMLLLEIDGKLLDNRQVVIRPELIIRESTGGNPAP